MTYSSHLTKRNIALFLATLAIVIGGVLWYRSFGTTATSVASMVVNEVGKGTVTTGIDTTGKIAAAEIVDLNIYKLTSRIGSVGVVNGAQVKKGDLLFSFDQSDTSVAVTEARLKLQEAQLALDVARGESSDPNTSITALTNDVDVLSRNLTQYNEDLTTALRDFLNEDVLAEPTKDRYDAQISKTAPVIGGTYDNTAEGEYLVEVYASGGDSGYSYHLSGLESGTYSVRPGVETKLGTRGLTITFPTDTLDISAHDEWIVALPNTYAPAYDLNLEDYNKRVADIQESIKSDTVTLANKKTQLTQAQRGDTTVHRSLDVESASIAVERARVNLQNALDGQTERYIVAPFSGTVEGMENVVVGATPTKDSNDPIVFGALISNEFRTTFSLTAHDADRVSVGQKVLVILTSVPNTKPLTAEIISVSSLPDSSTVAQYEIQARIVDNPNEKLNLRDGMLADIEIVQEEKADVVRVPVSAITYRDGNAYVTVVENLTQDQQTQMKRLGIVRVDTDVPITYERQIQVGLRGQYYVEVVDGLASGDVVEVSKSATTAAADAPVVRAGFGSNATRNHPPGE